MNSRDRFMAFSPTAAVRCRCGTRPAALALAAARLADHHACAGRQADCPSVITTSPGWTPEVMIASSPWVRATVTDGS
jgi:hypothetical protein